MKADSLHSVAQAWFGANRDRLVTSDFVVDEVLTMINVRFRRETALKAGQALFGERLCALIYLTEEDVGEAWEVFRRHSDKEWSFTDCTSYTLMKRLGISTAFAFDRQFVQMRGIRRVPN